MPMYDLVCSNGHEHLDLWLKLGERPPCSTCGEPTSTLWRHTASVIGDDIPGGTWVHHGICNADGTPKKYYTKSDMVKAAKAKGLTNRVEHLPDPKSGGDSSPHTSRWV